MSKIIGWIKGNLIIVISIVLIVLMLPAGFYFSNGWNKGIKEKAESAYNGEKRKLDGKSRLAYSLPAVLEGEEVISETRAPNSVVTSFYVAQKTERERQVDDVVDRGVALNMREHAELVPGLLPRAPDERSLRRLGLEMAERIAGTRDQSRQSVYQELLHRLNAGAPTDAASLGADLSDFKTRKHDEFAASSTDGKLDAEQEKQLALSLVLRRLGEYKGRADELTFYCTTDAIYTGPQAQFSVIPNQTPAPSSITEAQVFNWLWDYWVISDVLQSVVTANTNAASGAMSIPDAPVKSIESIRVSKIPVAAVEDTGGGGGRGGFGFGGSTDDAVVAEATTYTKHIGGQGESSYDIRTVEITAVIGSKQLPMLFDALSRTNYMTVTDVDLYEVDIWADLDRGYFYGSDHVVRAVIQIETVWLRSWMVDFMPDAVRTALGVPLEQSEEVDDG